MKLHQLLNNQRQLTVDVDGESLNVVYRPSAITPESLEAAQQLADERGDAAGMAATLARALISWDLEGEDGLYPVTEESIRKLPMGFINIVLPAIMRDMNPNRTKPAGLGGGSLAGA